MFVVFAPRTSCLTLFRFGSTFVLPWEERSVSSQSRLFGDFGEQKDASATQTLGSMPNSLTAFTEAEGP